MTANGANVIAPAEKEASKESRPEGPEKGGGKKGREEDGRQEAGEE